MDLFVKWHYRLNICMIQLYLHGGHALGDTLIAMTMFNSLNQPVRITTSLNSWYIKWKSIFCVGDQITLDPVSACETWINPPHFKNLESFKIFNRYFKSEHVNLFGQHFKIGTRGKKCVAVFVNNGQYIKDQEFFKKTETSTEYPYLKFHSWSIYESILKLVQSCGYDPLIIDHQDISIEHKTFLLNEYCDFVIGYEGGMCHLSHCLGLPCIMLPWKAEHFYSDFMHLDKQTYFVRNQTEIQTWTPTFLRDLVDGLYHEQGFNNRWLVDNPTANPEPMLDSLKNSHEGWHQQIAWAKQYIDQPSLGGY